MRTVPVGMGGTGLALFSSLVIQQPLEGAGALPLAQNVENPREQSEARPRSLLGMDTVSQEQGVPAGKAGPWHLTAYTDLRETSIFKPSTLLW